MTEWLEISLITKGIRAGGRIRMNPHSCLVITRTPRSRSVCLFTLQRHRPRGGRRSGEGVWGKEKGDGIKGGKGGMEKGREGKGDGRKGRGDGIKGGKRGKGKGREGERDRS